MPLIRKCGTLSARHAHPGRADAASTFRSFFYPRTGCQYVSCIVIQPSSNGHQFFRCQWIRQDLHLLAGVSSSRRHKGMKPILLRVPTTPLIHKIPIGKIENFRPFSGRRIFYPHCPGDARALPIISICSKFRGATEEICVARF